MNTVYIVQDDNGNLRGVYHSERLAKAALNTLIVNHRPIGIGETRGETRYKIIPMKVK